MRRDIGLLLAALGAFLILTAIAVPAFIVGQVVKFPLAEYETATLTGTNVQYYSAKMATEETGVTVRATYTIKGDKNAGNSTTSVWDEFQYSYDVTNGQVQALATRRAAFDRKTAQLVNCCGAKINGHPVPQSGVVGWVFPFGTKQQTYQVFDTTLNKPEPFVYSGTATIDGIPTYKFVEDLPPTQFGTLQVPGYFVGSSAQTVDAPEFYQTHVIYWVDPETGALVNVNNFEELTIRNPDTGVQGTVLYKGDLVMTPASLQNVVNLDKNGRNELFLLNTLLPLVGGIAGAVVLVAGILLARSRGHAGAEAGTVPPLSALAPPAAADNVPATASSGSGDGPVNQSSANAHALPAADPPTGASGDPA
jgi:Porin PorA